MKCSSRDGSSNSYATAMVVLAKFVRTHRETLRSYMGNFAIHSLSFVSADGMFDFNLKKSKV
jgi:hypothetical protein